MDRQQKMMGMGPLGGQRRAPAAGMRTTKRDIRASGEIRKMRVDDRLLDNVLHIGFFKGFSDDFNDNDI